MHLSPTSKLGYLSFKKFVSDLLKKKWSIVDDQSYRAAMCRIASSNEAAKIDTEYTREGRINIVRFLFKFRIAGYS